MGKKVVTKEGIGDIPYHFDLYNAKTDKIKSRKTLKLITIQAPVGALVVPKKEQVSWATKTLIKALKKDKGLRISWEANIAMAFKDNWFWYAQRKGKNVMNVADRHIIANNAAKYFLELLCDEIKRY